MGRLKTVEEISADYPLPDGYRWRYQPSGISDLLRLSIQKKGSFMGLILWRTVKWTTVSTSNYGKYDRPDDFTVRYVLKKVKF